MVSGQSNRESRVVVIGGGFTGLAAAYELSKAGVSVVLLEQAEQVGGLASSFLVDDVPLEKFYHHWFTNDVYVTRLVEELGLRDHLRYRASRTGLYYANSFYKLSRPLDLLRFKPLGWLDRIRLGVLTLRARRVKDWQKLEALTAAQWLIKLGGKKVFETIWEPLLKGKFGPYAQDISAVWFWNKLKLRGSSRAKSGAEMLVYFQGGFATLAEKMATAIRANGGEVRLNAAVTGLDVQAGRLTGVQVGDERIEADVAIATTALPLTAQWVKPFVTTDYFAQLQGIDYLANVCLVLELDRSLSEMYWINITDPNFPYVGIIEHTNFEPPETYHGKHIVYLSRYLPHTDALYAMSDEEAFAFSLPYIQRMFPEFKEAWVLRYHLFRARYSQPVVTCNYRSLIPDAASPIKGFYISSMAQIYPEDRGTNYAIRSGQAIANKLLETF